MQLAIFYTISHSTWPVTTNTTGLRPNAPCPHRGIDRGRCRTLRPTVVPVAGLWARPDAIRRSADRAGMGGPRPQAQAGLPSVDVSLDCDGARSVPNDLLRFLLDARRRGPNAWSATARRARSAHTLLNYAGSDRSLKYQRARDRNPYNRKFYGPGTRIPIPLWPAGTNRPSIEPDGSRDGPPVEARV